MAWVATSLKYQYKAYNTSSGSTNKGIYATLEYDDASVTVTSVTVRFTGSGANYTNSYWILLDPNGTNGLYKVKDNSSGYQSSSSFTLTKSFDAATFSVPALWFCCTGSVEPNTSTGNITYADIGTVSMYSCFNNKRTSWRTKHDATTVSIAPSKSVGTGPSGGSVTITDNYDNTFKVEGTLGSAGTNNSYKYAECYLWWTQAKATASDWTWYHSANVNGNKYTFANNTTTKSADDLAVNITDSSAATKAVYACVTTASTHGTAYHKYSSVTNIMQFCKPTPSTTRPTLSYSKSRLTIRENWTFSWSAATAANGSSPVKGYEICITKNSTEIPITINSSGVISKSTGTSTRVFWEGSGRTVTCNPANLGFVAGDKVRFWVRPYTKYGRTNTGTKLPSDWPDHTATVEATVQNAAVVNKYDSASGKWQEGIACVYKNGSWIEADSVLVYKNGNWVESI